MPKSPRRLIVLGAGAIGASLGALLFEGGAPVVLVARGANGRAIAERGVDLRLPGGSCIVRVPCVDDVRAAAVTSDDLVLLTTMGQHTAQAIEPLPRDVTVASFQNGLIPIEQVHGRGHPTLAAMVYVPAERRAPGVVALSAIPRFGTVLVGLWPRGDAPWADELARRLSAVGFAAETEADIGPWIRTKLLVNLGGVVVALCDEPVPDVVEAAQAEAVAVFHAAGAPFHDIDALIARVGKLELAEVDGVLRRGGSTRAALARKEPLETAVLHETVLDLGRRAGVATPVNSALVAMAERASREGVRPGSMSSASLREAVGLARATASSDPVAS
jgi:2-dehydropantoate 2-reductase